MRGLAAISLVAVAAVSAGCGGGAGASQGRVVVAAQPETGPAPLTEPANDPRVALELVTVPLRWVEKTAPAAAADVRAWSEVRENRRGVRTVIRHVLVKVTEQDGESKVGAANKKCEALRARVEKGEDFAKVALASDDVGTAKNGGALGTDPSPFVEPFRREAEALGPGEASKACVRSQFGWHVVKKDAATDDDFATAYKNAKAPELAKKLSEEILAGLGTTDDARRAIAKAVEAVLGEDALADPERPQAVLVDQGRLDALRLPPEARAELERFAKTARAGGALPAPIATKTGFVVGRAWGPAH